MGLRQPYLLAYILESWDLYDVRIELVMACLCSELVLGNSGLLPLQEYRTKSQLRAISELPQVHTHNGSL